jgi:plastocyanin
VTPPGGETSRTFTAIDVRTNRKAWQAQWDQPCIGGLMATAGGLVFAGEGNGNFDAYNASNGTRLWQFQTGAGANAPAISYQVGDTQYVAVASGGNFQLNFPRGDTLWVFALNGNIDPVEAPQAPASTATDAAVTDSPRIVDFEFQPGAFIIPPGTAVTWVNDGPSVHTSTSDDRLWDSGLLQPGQSFSFTFDNPGTYSYFCTVHPFMQARLIVDANAPPVATGADTAAPQADPEEKP